MNVHAAVGNQRNHSVGFALDADRPRVTCRMGDYEVQVPLDSVSGRTATFGSGVIVKTAPYEFLGAV